MWIKEQLSRLDRKKVALIFEPHALDRAEYWNLEVPQIKDTVRTGRIVRLKCEKPNKLCFEKYYGKENLTYIVSVRYRKSFIGVKTVWSRVGR